MFMFIRTNSITPGKWAQAMTFSHEVATHIKSVTGIETRVSVQVGGDPNLVAWSGLYENLAALEAVNHKLMSDPKYREILTKTADCFMPAAARDSIWRTV